MKNTNENGLTLIAVIITILIITILGMGSYIAYDKFFENVGDTNEIENTDIINNISEIEIDSDKLVSGIDILIPYKVGNKYGYINQYGEIKIEPQYNFADPFMEYEIDNKIISLARIQFGENTTPYDGLAQSEVYGGKSGYYGTIESEYDYYIDKNGNITNYKFDDVINHKNYNVDNTMIFDLSTLGLKIGTEINQYGYSEYFLQNKDGEKLFDNNFKSIYYYNDTNFIVGGDFGYGVFDISNNIFKQFLYENFNGSGNVSVGDLKLVPLDMVRFLHIDNEGKRYEDKLYEENKVLKINKNQKMLSFGSHKGGVGYIDIKGDIITTEYSGSSFINNSAVVMKKGEFGNYFLVDNEFNEISESYSKVATNHFWKTFDNSYWSNVASKFLFDYGTVVFVDYEDKYIIVDSNGNEISKKYDLIYGLDDGIGVIVEGEAQVFSEELSDYPTKGLYFDSTCLYGIIDLRTGQELLKPQKNVILQNYTFVNQ